MRISHYSLINKKIINTSNENRFIDEVVLFENDNFKLLNIDSKDINVFRSARHKNDMPTIFKLGKNTSSLKDGMIKISENGASLIKEESNLIISDHLTIIGNSSKAFVIAFLGGKKHLIKVEIRLDKSFNFKSIKVIAEINKMFKPNETFLTEDIEIYNTNNVNEAIKDFANKKAKGINKQKSRPSVYCTWYYYGETISYKDCLTNLKEIKNKKLPINVFQIDDGWEKRIGDWEANKKFLDMKKVSKEISKYNLIPGIWTSPFIVDKDSSFLKEHRDWLLLDNNNKPIIFNMNKNNFFIIDITIKDTWTYFEKLYRKLTKAYGFKYHKLDFTRAPITAINANYKNKFITIVEAYRNACLAIRKGMGDSFFLMCGGLYDPLIGIVDGQRVGSDVLSMWSAANKGGKTLPFTMKQNLLRYYMNAWWYNDADALVIRKNKKEYKGLKFSLGLLTDEEAKTSSINQLLTGGLFSMTEPLDKISKDRLDYLKHILPIKKIEIELVDIMHSSRFPNLIRIKHNKDYFLVVINYDDDKNLIKEFISKDINKRCTNNKKIKIKLPPHASTILKLTDKKIIEVHNKGHYLN